MKFKFSISLKLLLFILPLVCLPIAIVGYFSIDASEERVSRLVQHEQMVKVRATANRIQDVFNNSRIDLETISSLPVLEDYHIARSFRLAAEAEFHYDNIVRLFKNFIGRNKYYFQIRYIDKNGMELVKVQKSGAVKHMQDISDDAYFKTVSQYTSEINIHISDIVPSSFHKGYIIHWVKPVFSGWHEFAGMVVIDFDYDKIIEIVKEIRVGERGYAFLVDKQGRNTAHPEFEPYTHELNNYPDPSINKLVREMITGTSELKSYVHEGEEKVAAIAPIPFVGWSIAVSIPREEFRKEVYAIQTRVIQIAGITLLFTIIGVSLLSYYLLRPVRKLVTATNRIAGGDLDQKIPVLSSDELGDLTRSFNSMVKNLSRIQNELIRSEKLISLGKLSAGVAHEIRNPLNAMKGAVVYLQRQNTSENIIKEYSQIVLDEIDRLNEFVTEFLYFAKQSKPKPVPTDFNGLIVSIQNLFEKQAKDKNVQFFNNLSPDLPILNIDPHQMEQVLINVLVNAIDSFSDYGGSITFITSYFFDTVQPGSTHTVRCEILDNGNGIPEGHIDKIFDPFFSTKDSGTGLGLPLSLGIVENHGGNMEILIREGSGIRVVIDLPVNPVAIDRET